MTMDRRVEKKKDRWQRLIRLKNSLPGLIVESILITFGVLLAFAADSWKTQARLERDTLVVLDNLKNELVNNRSVVLEYLSYHDSLIHRLEPIEKTQDLVLESIDQDWLKTLYPMPRLGYLLQMTAWQTAHSSQVVRNISYGTTYNLTHCYHYQQEIDQTQDLIFEKLHEVSVAAGQAKVKVLGDLYQELSRQEHYLLGVYRDALVSIDQELTAKLD